MIWTRLVEDNRARVKHEVEKAVDGRLSWIMDAVLAEAKRRAPVRSGALRDSIDAAKTGPLKWRLTVGVSYGMLVELGTRKMRAQPFLAPAYQLGRDLIETFASGRK